MQIANQVYVISCDPTFFVHPDKGRLHGFENGAAALLRAAQRLSARLRCSTTSAVIQIAPSANARLAIVCNGRALLRSKNIPPTVKRVATTVAIKVTRRRGDHT